jgi:hypothetical protein
MSSTSEQKRVDETTTENTVEKPPVTPGAPSCTSDDTTNTINCGSLDPATLEMSVDGGTWIVFSSTGHTGNRTVDVRKKANGATPASPATRLTFTETVVVPNTPLVLGSINCTATVIQHGGSTTCQVTANDPQGIVSLRAEIDGVPVTVSVSGNTYSIPVSGLSAGIVA